MDISTIALQAVLAANLLPDDNVQIQNVVNADWDGVPKILITTEPEKTTEQTQFGIAAVETLLSLHCIAADRQTVSDLNRQACQSVYTSFSELENHPASGILCISLSESQVYQLPDRNEFAAHSTFIVLHRI